MISKLSFLNQRLEPLSKLFLSLSVRIFTFGLLSLAGIVSLWAREPRLLFIPIADQTQDNSFGYLGPSVTEAIRTKLKQEYVFEEASPETWSKIAQKNAFVYPEDYSNKSVALQLALLMQQDVVLSGSYRLIFDENEKDREAERNEQSEKAEKGEKGEKPKKRKKRKRKRRKKRRKRKKRKVAQGPKVLFRIALQNVAKRTLVAEKEFLAEIDNRLFIFIDEVAHEIVKEAAKVLPNKGSFDPSQYRDPPYENQLQVFFGFNAASVPSANKRIENGRVSFSPSEFPLTYSIDAQYLNHKWLGFLLNGLFVQGAARLHFGSTDKRVTENAIKTNVDVLAVELISSVGYKLLLGSYFYLAPALGVGYYFGRSQINLRLAGRSAVDADGEVINNVATNLFGPTARLALSLGFQFNRTYGLELMTFYHAFFEKGQASSGLWVNLGFSFGF